MDSVLDVVALSALGGVAAISVISLIRDYASFRRLTRTKLVCIQLTPPLSNTKTTKTTAELFGLVHELFAVHSRRQRILGYRHTISLEVASTRELGIQYRVYVPNHLADALERTIASYIPEARLKRIDSPGQDLSKAQILQFKQRRHWSGPLHETDLKTHDPISYLAGAMAKPRPGEELTLQLVLSPASGSTGGRVAANLRAGRHPEAFELSVKLPLVLTIWLLNGIMDLALKLVREIGDTLILYRRDDPVQAKPELESRTLNKLEQPLFYTDLRVAITSPDPAKRRERAQGLVAAVAAMGQPGGQQLVPRQGPMWYRRYKFEHRLPGLVRAVSPVLSASEIAGIYHFPYGSPPGTENLARSHSKTLPAPATMKQRADTNGLDVTLGENRHQGQLTTIGLTAQERERHLYVVGGTGNGKTTLLTTAMIQDIRTGKGLAFIDPHGDAAENLLGYIPPHRIKDVIYFNPDDLAFPVGLNLLELPKDITGDELLRQKDLITEATISIFRKIFSDDDEGGHRIEYILRNAVQTALTLPAPTLFTVFELLNDPKFRNITVRSLKDPDLKNFWQHELGKAGDFQRVKMSAGITAKIGRFLFSASARRALEQPRSTIDFDDILASGKILICNFSKGLLGEDTSELFGIMTLAKLQLAALKRARLTHDNRKPFYLYVDEFQNFATASFMQMLSEARKYRLYMSLAEQSTSQQADPKTIQVILANVGTVITFRTGNPKDEELLLPLFQPYVTKGEISNQESFNFYMRSMATEPMEPLSGITTLPPRDRDEDIAWEVIQHSRIAYAGEAKDPKPPSPSPKLPPKADVPLIQKKV